MARQTEIDLNLSHVYPRGLKKLALLLKEATPNPLKKLFLFRNFLGHDGAEEIAKILSVSPALTHLNLKQTKLMGDTCLLANFNADDIKTLQALVDVTVNAQETLDTLHHTINTQIKPEENNWQNREFHPNDFGQLKSFLNQHNQTLSGKLSDVTKGITTIAKAVQQHKKIEVLNIELNSLGDTGCRVLQDTLHQKSHPSLKEVKTNYNLSTLFVEPLTKIPDDNESTSNATSPGP